MIALTQKGVAREEAYALVQRNAMKVWQGKGDFWPSSRPTRTCASISARRSSRRNFDLDHHLKHVDTIFERVFGKAA